MSLVESWEASMGKRFLEPGRTWILENDPFALDAESRSRFDEGTFVSLSGHTHFSAERVADQLLPRVLQLFRSAAP